MTPQQKPMASKLGRPVSFDREEVLEQAMRVFWGAVLRQKGQRASKERRRSIHHRARSHRPVELALHTGFEDGGRHYSTPAIGERRCSPPQPIPSACNTGR